MPPKKKAAAAEEAGPESKDRIAIVNAQKCKPKKCHQEVACNRRQHACRDHASSAHQRQRLLAALLVGHAKLAGLL